MTNIFKIIFISICFLYSTGDNTQYDLKGFFQELFDNFSEDYQKLRYPEYRTLCNQYNLIKENKKNQDKYFQIYFIHDLLTGNGAINCSSGGLLEIPYFWHWVNPNPRHSILNLPDSILLSEMKAPGRFKNYKSYADIDRIPVLFLTDLLSENPKYYHPDCGSFYTFGWCSEREMTFVALLSIFGYDVKIKQSGIHTWSEIWLSFNQEDDQECDIILQVDNTFDEVDWYEPLSGTTEPLWIEDFGEGSNIRWYNEMANSEYQLQSIREIKVSRATQSRIENLISKNLDVMLNKH